MKLSLLPSPFAVCRLDPAAALPAWARSAQFLSIARTADELSIVCDDAHVPADVRAERGWRCLKVEGPIPFEVVGLAAQLTTALAAASVSVFFVSTFDTDYLLVKSPRLSAAIAALQDAGFTIA